MSDFKNGRSGEQGIWRKARVAPVFRGKKNKKKDKKRLIFARLLREVMRKNKVRWRNAPLDEYEQVYNKFWAEKKKVTEDDIELMRERVVVL